MGIKHYDVDGVADTLQLGKRGPSIKNENGSIVHRATDGTLAVAKTAPGVAAEDTATMAQLTPISDSVTTLQETIATQAAAISALQALVAKITPIAPETYDVVPGMAAATLLGTMRDGARVASISVEVTTAFDGEASLLIGDNATPDYYMDANHSDLAYTGTYTLAPPEGTPDRMITATLNGAATVGKATIRIEYA